MTGIHAEVENIFHNFKSLLIDMAKKIQDLSTETLLRRKRLARSLIWLMIFAILLSVAANVYDYLREGDVNLPALLGSLSACLAAALTLSLGLRRILEELDRRA
jgi:hypothetical protein